LLTQIQNADKNANFKWNQISIKRQQPVIAAVGKF